MRRKCWTDFFGDNVDSRNRGDTGLRQKALAMRPDNPNDVAYHWKALFRCRFNSVNRTINDPGVKLEFYDYDEIKASKLIVSTTDL